MLCPLLRVRNQTAKQQQPKKEIKIGNKNNNNTGGNNNNNKKFPQKSTPEKGIFRLRDSCDGFPWKKSAAVQ